ncbi:hypothetical protein GCM10025876_07060 [Demequina litorisediminis]|uniref:Uncharacterized protein n=1 Tax=Demequina litorisediminis TaxID=1849022 RepID=A0ABQ6IBE1_9MICO|nr:hypothetical protein GCM10025876_07060 [Demequina litorisediminis]
MPDASVTAADAAAASAAWAKPGRLKELALAALGVNRDVHRGDEGDGLVRAQRLERDVLTRVGDEDVFVAQAVDDLADAIHRVQREREVRHGGVEGAKVGAVFEIQRRSHRKILPHPRWYS